MKSRFVNILIGGEAGSLHRIASTAWQMVSDHGQVNGTKRVLVHGAAGNVGSCAVRLAK